MSHTDQYVVAIVVDPEFGERVAALVDRMPVWIADTQTNRAAAARARAARAGSGESVDHTDCGGLTTFTVDVERSPEFWCLDILDTIAGHHDRYSHSPGYSALEVFGTAPSPQLLRAFAHYRLTEITPRSGGFRASTSDGREAGSPNDT